MANTFDDKDALYFVLVNDELQYSLWPGFATIPAGWHIAHDKDTREACLDFVERTWTDMRPRSLVLAMGG
jgi:MbtH protein